MILFCGYVIIFRLNVGRHAPYFPIEMEKQIFVEVKTGQCEDGLLQLYEMQGHMCLDKVKTLLQSFM